MKKKILGLGIVAAVVISLVATGTWALFSDTEDTGNNVFQAGTIDLTLDGTGNAGVDFTNMKPGDTPSATIVVTNVGTLPGSLYASSGYVENDMTGAPTLNMSADDVAKMLIITSFKVDNVEMLSMIPIGPGSVPTVWSMVNDSTGAAVTGYGNATSGHGWFSYDTNMATSESHTYVLDLLFDTAAGNDYQGDGITWTFEFLLTQQ